MRSNRITGSRGLAAVVGVVLVTAAGRAEVADDPRGQNDQVDRYERSRVGDKPDQWVRHLDDPNPEVRLDAVKLLGESEDSDVHEYLMQAVENSDARVAAVAVEALGKKRAKDASAFLAQRLFLSATNPGLHQRILVALGRIKDPSVADRVLEFAAGQSDRALRGTAIRVVGEIGDASIRPKLQELQSRETDPTVKTLLLDADARIAARAADAAASTTSR